MSAEPAVPALPIPQLKLRGVGDVDAEHELWGANCGPAALAAAMGLLLSEVREAVSDRASSQLELVPAPAKFRGYMNVHQMVAAVGKLGGRVVRSWSKPELGVLAQPGAVLLVQWGGPWMRHPRAAARHSHWIAYQHGYFGTLKHFRGPGQLEQSPGWIADVNDLRNSWIPRWLWEAEIVPLLLPERGDGTWSLSWVGEVRRGG